MKNKISDLRNHMFAALERLGNEELSKEQMSAEIERSRAISECGKVIVESAKAEIMFAKMTGQGMDEARKFLEENVDGIKRPASVYTNLKSPLGIANGG
jgi:hypothetical protein